MTLSLTNYNIESVGGSFSFRIDNVKNFADICRCLVINTRQDHICVLEASEDAITFIVTEKVKSTQARLTIPSSVFDDYIQTAESEAIQLSINLTTFIDCISLFSSSLDETALTVTYMVEDAILRLSLEEAGALTTCDISTIFRDESEDIDNDLFTAFMSKSEEAQVILKSDQLKELVNELCEGYGVAAISIQISKNPELFLMSATGVLGTCEISIPRSSDVFISFRCDHDLRWSYSLASIQLGMKALSVAKETFIRVNGRGITCIQHQVESSRGQDIFVDFFMIAEDGRDDGTNPDDEEQAGYESDAESDTAANPLVN